MTQARALWGGCSSRRVQVRGGPVGVEMGAVGAPVNDRQGSEITGSLCGQLARAPMRPHSQRRSWAKHVAKRNCTHILLLMHPAGLPL